MRKKSKPIKNFEDELNKIVDDLRNTLFHLQDTLRIGRALAAPRINHMKRLIFFNLKNRQIVMVNPEITWKSDEI